MKQLCQVDRTKGNTTLTHPDTTKSRIALNTKHTKELIDFFQQFDPLAIDDTRLRNIVTGVIAAPNVNVDEADVVGEKILSTLYGKKIDEYSFSMKLKVVTMAKMVISVPGGDVVKIDPQALFTRLLLINATAPEAEKKQP